MSETVAAALFGKQNQRLMDERSPGIPADCLRDYLTGLIIPYSLETWLRVPETPPRHLSEYATYRALGLSFLLVPRSDTETAHSWSNHPEDSGECGWSLGQVP